MVASVRGTNEVPGEGRVRTYQGSDRQAGVVHVIDSGVIDHADFTDGGAAVGTVDILPAIPANSIVLGAQVDVIEAFAGEAAAVIQVGYASGDLDAVSPNTDPDLANLTASHILCGFNPVDLGNGDSAIEAPTTVRVTITTTDDWTHVTAGKIRVRVMYLHLPQD